MKYCLRVLLMALLVLGFAIPGFNKAEAAKIAVLPLAMQEQDDTASRVWIEGCMKIFKFPEYDMVDDAAMDKALKEVNYAQAGKQGPSEELLKAVMEKTGAKMAVMMTLDELSMEPIRPEMYEEYYKLVQRTRIMFVNNITGTKKAHRVNDSDEVEYAIIVRSDYMHDQFRNTVILELKKITKSK